jgi:hypothetical protein
MEAFSWGKFFNGFSTLVGWAKFASFWVKVLLVVIPVLGSVWAYHAVYTKGYVAGKDVGYKSGYSVASDWFAAHPIIQTGDNCTINNNVTKPNNHFQFGVWPLRLGWCE